MAITYRQGANDDLAPLKSVGIDDDSGTAFWGGTQKCFAHIALAAFLVTTSLSTALAQQVQQKGGDQSDVPAGSLVKSTALDYGEFWRNPETPVPASLYQNLPLGEQDDQPAGSLFGQDDEDFWVNPVAPVQATLRWPQQFAFGEQSDVPAGQLKKFTSPDEDYWQNPIFALPAVGGVQPAVFYQALPLGIEDDYPVPQIAFTPDEDYWQNPVFPLPAAGGVQGAALYQPLPYLFDSADGGPALTVQDEDFWSVTLPPAPNVNACPQPWLFDPQESAGSLYGQPDEDFWLQQQLPPPVSATLYQALPYPPSVSDPEELPAASLYGQADEDVWLNPAAPVTAALYQHLPLGIEDDYPTPSTFAPDEDYWQTPAPPLAPSFTFRFADAEDFPSIAQAEDFWQNLVAPTSASLYQSLPIGEREEIPAGSLFGQADEDFWQNQVRPVPASNYVALPLGDPEELSAATLHGQPDEDLWRNPVAPVPASLCWPQPYLFDIQEPAGSLYGQADEDYWQNPVAAVPATFYRSPVLGDQEEIPGSLVAANPDEDYWRNPSAPTAASLYQNLPYLFDSVDFIPTFQPIEDEDLWQNPAAPVQASLYRSPVFTDPEEVPAGSLKKFVSPDEDYWQLNVLPAPVAATLYQRLPYGIALRDVEEIPAGRLFGQADEDFWKNAVAPVAASLYQRLPIGDPEELPAGSLFGQADEDFWVNPSAPVPASLKWLHPFSFEAPEPAGRLVNAKPDEDYWQNHVAPVTASLYQSLPYAFDAAAESTEFEFGAVATTQAQQSVSASGTVTGGQTLGGGIAWPYPTLSERHWSAPPSSKLTVAPQEQPKPKAISGKVATIESCDRLSAIGTIANPVSGKAKSRSRKGSSAGVATLAMGGRASTVGENDRSDIRAEHFDTELEILLAWIAEMS